MFVYFKLYREPVSPTILTPLCEDQEKKNSSPWRWGCAREGMKRLSFFFFLRTSSFSSGQSTARYNLNELLIRTRLRWRILSISCIDINNI